MKSFRRQFLECQEKGGINRTKCPRCGQELLICRHFAEICQSKLCRGLRRLLEPAKEEKIDNHREDVKFDGNK